MNIEKKTIKGKKGITVIYTLKNFVITEIPKGINIKWEPFTFYSPKGNFSVPGISENIFRDDTLDKTIFVIVSKTNGIEIIEVFEDSEDPGIVIEAEGDIVAFFMFPAYIKKKISGVYKEVING